MLLISRIPNACLHFQCWQPFCRPFAFYIDSVRCPEITLLVWLLYHTFPWMNATAYSWSIFFHLVFNSFGRNRRGGEARVENENWDVSILSFLFAGTQIKEYLWWNSFIKHFSLSTFVWATSFLCSLFHSIVLIYSKKKNATRYKYKPPAKLNMYLIKVFIVQFLLLVFFLP